MKCKQPCSGFELKYMSPLLMTVTIRPQTPPILYIPINIYIYITQPLVWYCKK